MKDPLVALIENKLGWGKGDTWSNKDFEVLSERIFEETNKRLSVTTLKRIWGRAEWVANPSIATLDILSEFAGHRDWRAFVNTHKAEITPPQEVERSKPKKAGILILLILGLGVLYYVLQDSFREQKSPIRYDVDDFEFASRPVSKGIPNSVVFEYRASAAPKDAKLEIQQDWDRNKRLSIKRTESVATSIYYHPGFFKSKLVVDDTIVQENDVFITTDDWLGMIQRDSIPIYLKQEEFYQDSILTIDYSTVASYDLDPKTDAVVVSFYQVQDFGGLYTDDFELSATVKNDFDLGRSACQNVKLFMLYDGGAIGIPLSKKGCSAELTLMTFEGYIDGKKNDLSNFGVDFSDYVSLRCRSKDQRLDIYVNDILAHQSAVPIPTLEIKGISIHFEGTGSIKNIEFKAGEKTVYRTNLSEAE